MQRIATAFKLATVTTLLVLLFSIAGKSVVAAPPTDLFISEYIEGSSNNKAIEIYNGTGAAVNLATGSYVLQMYFNGSTTAGTTISLTGTVANGDVYVVADDNSNATILAQTDQQSTASFFNGDDAIILRKGGAAGTIVDSFGQLGSDPGAEWGTGLTSTADNTLVRKSTVCAGDTNPSDAFDPATEWDGFAVDIFTNLGSHTASCGGGDVAPSVDSTTPADNATNVAANSDISITFSEAVDVTGTWFTISCDTSGVHTAAVTGGPTTYTLNPDTDFTAGEICTVTIESTLVTDQDTDDPPDEMAADYVFDFTVFAPACGTSATLIHDIQGNGASSPVDGTIHTIEGVVVGDFQNVPGGNVELNGFFVQEEDDDADADPATSEGILVFENINTATNPAVDVSVGDVVRVTGTVDEEFGMTVLETITGVEVCSTGSSVTPVSVSLPLSSATFLERYEGMAVTFSQELSVTEIFTLGRFGEVLLSSDGRLPHPTQIAEPGAPANAVATANDLNQILLDDGYSNQNPDPLIFPDPGLSASNTLRGGDTVTGLFGALHFAFGAYRVQPVGTVDFEQDNPRPNGPEEVGGSLKVASFNVLNYFTTIDTGADICGPTGGLECRGADSVSEFERQRAKIITALVAINADVVGLIEIENNESASLQDLVDGLNDELGPGTYDFIATGTIGTDAIKQGFIYKPGTVTPVGDFAVLDSSFDPAYIDTLSRPMLVQTFQEISSGELFTVAVNHLKSKGSDCDAVGDPDTGDEQGNCNLTRTAAAEVIVDYLATDPTGSGDPDFLIIGDLNAYAMEDPIAALEDGGYTNLLALFQGMEEYTFVFDGEWGNLDHALANSSLLSQVAGTTSYHINSDEPIVLDYNVEFKSVAQQALFYAPDEFRASDHDAVIVGLTLGPEAPETGTITVTKVVSGTIPGEDWSFTGDLGEFTLPAAGGTISFTEQISGTYTITETADLNYTTEVVCTTDDSGSNSVTFDLEPGAEVECTFTNTEIVTPAEADIYIATEEDGTVDAISYTTQDILYYDGADWSLFFEGAANGLDDRHDIYSIHVNAADDLYLTLFQNSVNVPGLGSVKGHDILHYDGIGLSFFFDGSDVGLSGVNEKIDALHILDGGVDLPGGGSCQAYLLISTFGTGKVPLFGGGQLSFNGEDVLGFCATNLGEATSGFWHMVLDGSTKGMPKNSTFSLSASDDGQVLYFTTKNNFNVGGANGSHSEVYRYDFDTDTFSGPVFSVPPTGILEKVTGLHTVGELGDGGGGGG